jgi:ribose transport system substrate-binding protein
MIELTKKEEEIVMSTKRVASMLSMLIILVMLFSGLVHAAPKGTIGICSHFQDNPFFRLLSDTAKEVFEEAGYEVIIADGRQDQIQQTNDVDNFISMGVKGILLSPVDSYGMAAAVNRAYDAGIPVVTTDMCVYNARYASTIESDNYQAGYVVGEYLVTYWENLVNQGKASPPFKLACGTYPQANSCQARQEGLEDAIRENAPEVFVEIVERFIISDISIEIGYEVGQNFLTTYPDLDAMHFGCNDLVALGALRAIEDSGRKDVVVSGVDGQREAVDAINRGTAFKTTGAQYPQVIGYVGAETLLDVIDGVEVPTYIKVACRAIHLPFQPFDVDPRLFVEQGEAISRVVDVSYPISEPVR